MRKFYNQNTGETQTETELLNLFETGCTGFATFDGFILAALEYGSSGCGLTEV